MNDHSTVCWNAAPHTSPPDHHGLILYFKKVSRNMFYSFLLPLNTIVYACRYLLLPYHTDTLNNYRSEVAYYNFFICKATFFSNFQIFYIGYTCSTATNNYEVRRFWINNTVSRNNQNCCKKKELDKRKNISSLLVNRCGVHNMSNEKHKFFLKVILSFIACCRQMDTPFFLFYFVLFASVVSNCTHISFCL